MKPYLTIAALLAVTIPANAANSFIYDCGAAEFLSSPLFFG
jgi:hypothetical protein